MAGGPEVNDETREKLLALRSEIAAESASLVALLPSARRAIVDADSALKAAKSANHVREVIAIAVGNEAIANRLAAFLRDAEIDNAIAAAPVRTRHELAHIEGEIADCMDALRQLDRAVAGSWPTGLIGPEPPTIVKRRKPAPVEIDLVEGVPA
jgi:hypothetical protein